MGDGGGEKEKRREGKVEGRRGGGREIREGDEGGGKGKCFLMLAGYEMSASGSRSCRVTRTAGGSSELGLGLSPGVTWQPSRVTASIRWIV